MLLFLISFIITAFPFSLVPGHGFLYRPSFVPEYSVRVAPDDAPSAVIGKRR